MSTKEFLYRYKDVDAIETKTMLQKNVKDHRKDLNVAVDDVFKSDDEITIVSSDLKAVTFNKSLLVLFSKSMRSCLATFSCCTEPTIFLPDCSAESVIKVHDILVKQVTKAGIKSFKDIHTVVETASALGIDIADLQFGASAQLGKPAAKSPVIVDVNLSDEEDEPDDAIQEMGSLDEVMMDDTLGDKERLEDEPPLRIEYDVSSDDDSSGDEDDKESDNDDGSSSDGEVAEDENEAKTVSESVSPGKKLVNETFISEDENSDGESENDKKKEDTRQDYEEEGNISDEESVYEKTNFEISGITELQNEDTMNISTESDVIDEVLHYNKKFLQSERMKLDRVNMVPSENITNVNNSLESLKGYKNLIDDKLGDLLGNKNNSLGEDPAPMDHTNSIVGNEDLSPLKDEILLPAKKEESPNDMKKNLMEEGNDYENRFRCTICYNIMKKLAVCTFKEHYSTAHFQKEIFELYIKNPAETVCRVDGCGKDFGEKNKSNLVRHIGSTHNKAMEILQLKGMEVPAVFSEVNKNTKSTKRKRSDVVKVEKMSKVKTELEESSLSFECEMCGLYYSSKSNLERHLFSKHK